MPCLVPDPLHDQGYCQLTVTQVSVNLKFPKNLEQFELETIEPSKLEFESAHDALEYRLYDFESIAYSSRNVMPF